MYQDWFKDYEKITKEKKCKCCEYIKDLQELEEKREKIPGIKHILKARLTTITRREGIRRNAGVIDWKAYPLNYCPMCGRKLKEGD